jgi:hypothetical protein
MACIFQRCDINNTIIISIYQGFLYNLLLLRTLDLRAGEYRFYVKLHAGNSAKNDQAETEE